MAAKQKLLYIGSKKIMEVYNSFEERKIPTLRDLYDEVTKGLPIERMGSKERDEFEINTLVKIITTIEKENVRVSLPILPDKPDKINIGVTKLLMIDHHVTGAEIISKYTNLGTATAIRVMNGIKKEIKFSAHEMPNKEEENDDEQSFDLKDPTDAFSLFKHAKVD